MEYKSQLAENIKEIIRSTGLKQYVVAERAGFSQSKFSDMLNGRKIINAADIPPIANALNVSANKLFGLEDKKYNSEGVAVSE